MAKARADRDRLFATRWVHVFEEDTSEGAVYRPADDNIPLSRRPRAHLELAADGTAHLYMPGPDDRFVEQPATWRKDGDTLVIQTAAAKPTPGATPAASPSAAASSGTELRIVNRSPKRLVVQVRKR